MCISELSAAVNKYIYDNLQRKKVYFYFGSWFQRFSPQLVDPVPFRPVARQYIMIQMCDRTTFYLEEKKGRRARGWTPIVPLRARLSCHQTFR